MSSPPSNPREENRSERERNSRANQEEIKFKRPEFIIIDDTRADRQERSSSSREAFGIHDPRWGPKTQIQQSPLSLRVVFFFGALLCFVFALGLIVWSVILTLGALVLLFQNPKLNRAAKSFWRLYRHIVLAGLGCAIGILSPTWGIGLLMLYFAWTGEVVGSKLLKKIIQSSFEKF